MDNTETVRGLYAAFGRGDIPAILDRLAENVEWEHDAADHGQVTRFRHFVDSHALWRQQQP